MDRSMIDAASGGALMDKTTAAARLLISNMASNTQQFRVRGGANTSKNVSEVNTFNDQRLENQLIELTSLVSDNGFFLVVLNSYQITKVNYSIANPSFDSPWHWLSRSWQRQSQDDLGRDNPAWSQLSAVKCYRDGLSLSQTKKHPVSPNLVQFPHSSSQSISALGSLMAIAKGSSIVIPRIYAIATSSVDRD
ncbi:hypothetical protein CR513_29488, partial [Mucuna pruriens]